MAIQDNSPTRTNIRWSNIKFLHKGMIYVIKDGFTNKKYVYWKSDTPNEFLACDILPDSQVQIIMMNNEGVAYLYPSVDLIIDNAGQKKNDNTVLINHISNQDIHISLEEKEKISSLEESCVALYEQIDLLARRIYEVKLTADKIEELNSVQDRTIKFLEDSIEFLSEKIDKLESKLENKNEERE